MHICMIVSGYGENGTTPTGAELQAQNLLRQLQFSGHQITIIAKKHTFASPYHENQDKLRVYRVGPLGLRCFMLFYLFASFRSQFDVVHIHGQDALGTFAVFLCKLLSIPCVLKITIAGRLFVRTPLDKLFPRKWMIFRRLVNHISREATAYIAISSEIASELIQAKFPADRIVSISNGVDVTRFFPLSRKQKMELRNSLGLSPTATIILFVGRLIHRKGFDLLLAAAPQLLSQAEDIQLVIVGTGKPEMNNKAMSLTQQYQNRVIFVGERSDPAPFYQAADIFLFPSRKEGLPNALIEGMACGCTCIASDIGGCTDLIIPDKNGLLFPSGNAGALTTTLLHLLHTAGRIEELGEAAALFATQQYDIKTIAKRIETLYQSLHSKLSLTDG